MPKRTEGVLSAAARLPEAAVAEERWTDTASNAPCRVLIDSSNLCEQFRGGKEELMIQTMRHVNKSGLADVKFFDKFQDRLEDFDIYHTFGLHTENVKVAALARQRGLRVVCTPVFWRSYEFHQESSGTLKALATLCARALGRSFPSIRGLEVFGEQQLLDLADVILPSSVLEAELLSKTFRVERSRVKVIENGVDSSFSDGDAAEFEDKFGVADFLLYVGRIEPRKNILRLAYAAARLGEKLVLIGSSASNEEYLKDCLSVNPERTWYIGSLPPGSTTLKSAYKAAKLFVLPSWFETPGIAALEAAVAGCRIVITDRGSTTEYFRDEVEYCNPASVSSICDAIRRAEVRQRSSRLASRLVNDYSWERIGRRIGSVYSVVTRAKR